MRNLNPTAEIRREGRKEAQEAQKGEAMPGIPPSTGPISGRNGGLLEGKFTGGNGAPNLKSEEKPIKNPQTPVKQILAGLIKLVAGAGFEPTTFRL
jgi:hypothetical protein